MGIISKEYCCCAIPLYQTGIYAILAETVVVSVALGILAFAAPHVTAIAVPGILPIIFGVLSIILGLVQILGFVGVFKEKPPLFQRYVQVNLGFFVFSAVVALVIIVVSTARHSAATDACVAQFIAQQSTNATGSAIDVGNNVTSGRSLCNIWVWAQVGVMFIVFLIVVLTQVYFYLLTRNYSVQQRDDHQRYSNVYSVARESFIRSSGTWDRQSLDSNGLPRFAGAGGHARNMSKSSSLRNEVFAEGEVNAAGPSRHGQQASLASLGESGSLLRGSSPSRGGGGGRHGHQPSTSSALRGVTYADEEEPGYEQAQSVYAPPRSRLADAEPTPVVPSERHWHGGSSYADAGDGVRYPEGSQRHPAEGAMGRKTPRYE